MSVVVGDDRMGQAEAADYVSPHKRVDLPSGDVSQGFCFDLLSEVIYGD